MPVQLGMSKDGSNILRMLRMMEDENVEEDVFEEETLSGERNNILDHPPSLTNVD